MKPVPIFRAAHIVPHVQMAREIGAPIEKILSQVRLPQSLVDEPQLYLPLHNTLAFVEHMRLSEGIDDLSVHAVNRMSFDDLDESNLASIRKTPNLLSAMQQFCWRTGIESNFAEFWLECDKAEIRFCSRFTGSSIPYHVRHAEWSQLYCKLMIVRVFVGQSWQPSCLHLQSSLPVDEYAHSLFPNTPIRTGARRCQICIPNELASTPNADIRRNNPDLASSRRFDSSDFIDSVELILRSYVFSADFSVNHAAEIVGMSIRSFQRKLQEEGTSYSELYQKIYYERTLDLLQNPDYRIIDIAHITGYDCPSHFTRAFRRISGITPSAYRKVHLKAS